MLPKLTVVISPLISLMKDQVDALTARGTAGDVRQQHAHVITGLRSPGARDARRREAALRRARALRLRQHGRTPARRRRVAARGRRSALHQRVGPRLPAELSAHRAGAREARLAADRRAHGDGDAARAHGHRRAAQARVADDDHHRIRSQESVAITCCPTKNDHGQGRRARPPAAVERGTRRRLRVDAKGRRAHRAAARPGAHSGRRVSRRPGRRSAPRRAGRVHDREGARDRRDERVRHGHRQAERAARAALRHARHARGVLPGGGPRRPRRQARRRAICCTRFPIASRTSSSSRARIPIARSSKRCTTCFVATPTRAARVDLVARRHRDADARRRRATATSSRRSACSRRPARTR